MRMPFACRCGFSIKPQTSPIRPPGGTPPGLYHISARRRESQRPRTSTPGAATLRRVPQRRNSAPEAQAHRAVADETHQRSSVAPEEYGAVAEMGAEQARGDVRADDLSELLGAGHEQPVAAV